MKGIGKSDYFVRQFLEEQYLRLFILNHQTKANENSCICRSGKSVSVCVKKAITGRCACDDRCATCHYERKTCRQMPCPTGSLRNRHWFWIETKPTPFSKSVAGTVTLMFNTPVVPPKMFPKEIPLKTFSMTHGASIEDLESPYGLTAVCYRFIDQRNDADAVVSVLNTSACTDFVHR